MTDTEACPRCELTLDESGSCPKSGCDYTRPKLTENARQTGRAGVAAVRELLKERK